MDKFLRTIDMQYPGTQVFGQIYTMVLGKPYLGAAQNHNTVEVLLHKTTTGKAKNRLNDVLVAFLELFF